MPYRPERIEDKRRTARESARRRRKQNPEAYRRAQARFSEKMRMLLKAAKLERGCAHCGYKDNADALEFDHIIPRRITGERPIRMHNAKRELEEMLMNPNVQVLCANCHAIKSVGERKRTFDITVDPS